jgi:DNA-binding CsgD family transcriptional regulator
MPAVLRNAERTIGAIEELASAGLVAQDLLTEASRRIDRVVPSDGCFLGATDPQTTLLIGAGIVRDLPEDMCAPTWDYEFQVPDYLKFADIASSGRTLADIHDVTGGRPERSARWREYGAATGFRSEVRSVFAIDGAVWGVAQFDRLGDSPRFTDDEKAWLERVAPIIARGLRRAMLTLPACGPEDRGPGLVVLDDEGATVSVTREAADWLDEIDSAYRPVTRDGVSIPFEVQAFAARVRARLSEDGGPPPRARLRTRSGVWLLVHGSPLQGSDALALIIEPAKASEVAPLIVEAYGLTRRELEVTRLIARGLGTTQIAATVHLSPHTVRDHVKAVFEKVGVSSRGELVARVFADHYAPVGHTD